jgi:hypothetical protein
MSTTNRTRYHSGNPHICRDNLGPKCVCKICGAICHELEDDSNGFGTGLVHRWCTRCNEGESYYDDTGSTVYCTLWPDGYDHYKNEWTEYDYIRAMKNNTDK